MRRLAKGSAPPDAWGKVGTTVGGHFDIVRVIGAGPHGTVFEAIDRNGGRRVALKVLHSRFAHPSRDLRPDGPEIPVSGGVLHPNLVDVEAVGRLADGSLYLVTELVEGIDVATVLSEAVLPELQALRFARHALLGLQAAHRAGRVHGDLKAENLIVAGIGVVEDHLDEPVRLLDVALVRIFQRVATSPLSSRSGPYAAPEVAATGVLTPRGDTFAMGVVLAEMLGVDAGVALSAAEVVTTREAEFLLWRALQPDPRQRYRDATEMLGGVDAALTALHRRG